ncbi:ParA family protein [bacterium]|nr:ParA family protein [bacterium]
MGKVISLVNPKGGVCKSTLALCLGSVFGNSCIIDQDPQGSIWSWYQDGQLDRDTETKGKTNPTVEFYGIEDLTIEALEDYADRFDYVFIDCPGESEAGIKTKTALVYSDLIIIPVKESEFDIASLLDHLMPLLGDATDSNERSGRIVFLPTFCHVNSKAERIIARFQSLQQEVLPAVLRSRKVFEKFSENGQTLGEYAENARFVNDRIQARAAIDDIEAIATQIKNLLK